jgi:DNA-binding NarL/FixJ family response regulator
MEDLVKLKNRIIIADTQFLVVESLTSLLNADERYSVVAVVSSKSELIKVLSEVSDGLLLIDIALIDNFEITDLKNINYEYPDVSILILTNSLTKPEILELTKSGIKNIIYKTADREELLTAIDMAAKRKNYYSEEVLDLLIEPGERGQVNEKPGRLTFSEIEIVKLIANGLTAKEIALKKHISFHTVNTHRKNIFRKLGVSNSSELIMVAIKAGWIDNIEYYI